MPDVKRAIAHLEDAEATIMSWWQRIEATPEDAADDDFPPISIALAAALRSVSRAVGALEGVEPTPDIAVMRNAGGQPVVAIIDGIEFVPNDDPHLRDARHA